MKSRKNLSKLESFIGEVAAVRRHASESHSGEITGTGDEIANLANLDYTGPLRKCLNREQLDELIHDARKTIWPHLNLEPLRLGSIKEFSKTFSKLGIVVCPTRMSSERNQGLLGFYIRKTQVLSGRSMICVNTNHHPAAVGATFVHEMGHHLTSEIFGSHSEPASFLAYTEYAKHLNEPSELVADIMVSLGIYPQPLARKMLARKNESLGTSGSVGSSSSTILKYLAKQYGLSFEQKLPGSQKVQYLAGLLHYTKLREALRDEFDL
jgi:hypothetical protein